MGQVLVLGLISGGIYALFALGVVMVFRGTGVLSFAQGEIGTAALFIAAYLVTDQGMSWYVGAVTALVAATAIGALFEFAIVRRMVGSDPVAVAVATVGLVLFLLSVEIQFVGESPKQLTGPFKGGTEIAGVIVSPTQMIAIVLAFALGFGLQAALRRTDFGLGILAAAADPTAARMVGVPLHRVSMTVWGAGAALSAIAALLVEPTVGAFVPGYASELYVVGLAAAVVGGLTSLPGAVVGGIVIGVAESGAQRVFGQKPLGDHFWPDWLYGLPGLRYVVVLVILLVVLLGRQLLPELRRRLEASGRLSTSAAHA